MLERKFHRCLYNVQKYVKLFIIHKKWLQQCVSRPVGAAGGKDGEKSARNNGAGKIRRRLSRASFTATCATKPECGLFYLIANKIVIYLAIKK